MFLRDVNGVKGDRQLESCLKHMQEPVLKCQQVLIHTH